MQRWIGGLVISRIYPLLARLFGVEPGSLWLKEAVVIKYVPADADETGGAEGEGVPAGVAEHRDASVFSFNILLNDPAEFGGGGTLFPGLGLRDLQEQAGASEGEGGDQAAGGERGGVVRLARGGAVLHAGKAEHAGLPVTRGSRFMLAGFVQLCGRCHPE